MAKARLPAGRVPRGIAFFALALESIPGDRVQHLLKESLLCREELDGESFFLLGIGVRSPGGTSGYWYSKEYRRSSLMTVGIGPRSGICILVLVVRDIVFA